MHRHLILGLGLFMVSNASFADWLPNPDKWLREQCQQRITQFPELKLNPTQQNQTCNCMTKQAKTQLSARDLLNLASLSENELQQKYADKAKQAFNRCHKSQTPT